VLEDAHNLKEGAWKNPAVLEAAKACKQIGDKYLMAGTLGLSHTESQQMFFMGKAAVIPVGTWLETESRDVIPADFVLRYMNPPAVKGGKGDPSSVHAQNDASSDFHIPTKCKHPKDAINFVKFMTSPEVGKFITESKGSPLSTIGSEKYIKSQAVASAFEFVKKAKYTWNTRAWESRYPTVQKQVNISLHDLMNGKITAEQFCDQVEAEAGKVRQDPDTLWFPIQLQIEVGSK
jgi:N-acetylglucosamine transport system substrate-binding protein